MVEIATPISSAIHHEVSARTAGATPASSFAEAERGFYEAIKPAQEAERARRHAERVRILEEAANSGVIVYTARIEL